MVAESADFRREVVPRLRGLLTQVRMYAAAEGLAWLAVFATLCFAIQISLDWLLRLRVDLRATLLAVVAALLAYVAWRRLIRPLLVPLTLDDVAAVLERRFPQMQSRLISSVQFTGGGGFASESNSPLLIRKLLEQTTTEASHLPVQQVLNHRRARLHGGIAAAVVAGFLLLTLLAPEAMGTWFERNILLNNTPWKQHTTLEVLNDEDGDGLIYTPAGDDFILRVRSAGVRPQRVDVELDFESGESAAETMTAVGADEFRFIVPRLTEGLRLWVSGGDARLDPIQVQVVERPRVSEARVTVTPPSYTNEKPYDLRPGKTLIETLDGSGVEIVFQTTKPVVEAVLMQGDVEVTAAQRHPDGWYVQFNPRQDADYTFLLKDELGLIDNNPRVFLVRMIADSAPAVTLKITGVSDMATPQAILPWAVEVKDRYGVAEAALIHQLGADQPVTREPLGDLPAGSTQWTASGQRTLSEWGVVEGQNLSLWADAADTNNVSGPGIGESARYGLRIVSSEELVAELGRREQEFRQEFERLIDMQERLRGDLLSAAADHQAARPASELAPQLTALERRQRQISRQAVHIASQFERIHEELFTNQLGSDEVSARLKDGIVTPLQAVASRRMSPAADAIDRVRREPSAALFTTLDAQQADVLAGMRAVLEAMNKWEGFHETISLMQTIIKLQKELKTETEEELNRQLDDIFK